MSAVTIANGRSKCTMPPSIWPDTTLHNHVTMSNSVKVHNTSDTSRSPKPLFVAKWRTRKPPGLTTVTDQA